MYFNIDQRQPSAAFQTSPWLLQHAVVSKLISKENAGTTTI